MQNITYVLFEDIKMNEFTTQENISTTDCRCLSKKNKKVLFVDICLKN